MADSFNKSSSEDDDWKKIEEDAYFPVEEVSPSEKVSEENVKDAIEEINPTIDSLGQRG